MKMIADTPAFALSSVDLLQPAAVTPKATGATTPSSSARLGIRGNKTIFMAEIRKAWAEPIRNPRSFARLAFVKAWITRASPLIAGGPHPAANFGQVTAAISER